MHNDNNNNNNNNNNDIHIYDCKYYRKSSTIWQLSDCFEYGESP